MYWCCIFAVSSGKHIMYVFIFSVKAFVSVHLYTNLQFGNTSRSIIAVISFYYFMSLILP